MLAVTDKVLEDVELARRRQAPQGRASLSICRRRGFDAHVPFDLGDDRRLDEEPRPAVRQCDWRLAVWRALDILLLVGLPVLAIELWNARFTAHSLEWLGAGWVLALLWVRTLFRFYGRVAKSNFPFSRLRDRPAGASALCCAALSKLVSTSGRQAGKLEGQNLSGVRELSAPDRNSGCPTLGASLFFVPGVGSMSEMKP